VHWFDVADADERISAPHAGLSLPLVQVEIKWHHFSLNSDDVSWVIYPLHHMQMSQCGASTTVVLP
jgi:hypothetical protein